MTVQISEGLYLTDRDANRFARYMLTDLQRYTERLLAYMDSDSFAASMGNPTGQRRFFKRFIKALGPAYLRGSLQPGKNKRFNLDYMTFIAATDGLLLATIYVEGHGVSSPTKSSSAPVLAFSIHALQRLIQRAGVRTGDDYLPILKALAVPAFVAAGAAALSNIPDGQSWPLPVRINNQRVLLLLRQDSPTSLPTVVTAYPGAWRAAPEIDALESMLDSFDLYAEDWGGVEPYRAAFITASSHFKAA